MKNALTTLLITSSLAACVSCSGDPEPVELTDADIAPVVERYAALVDANYTDSITGAKDLQSKIDAFIAAPSAETMKAAKDSWLATRDVYGQTEGFRFYGGPIDDDDGPEGQINAWPLDENYIDYVDGNPDAGIVNMTTDFPTIDKALLASLNEKDGDANISTGYHAIEFLLWGQDLSDGPGAGQRDFTDYTDAANADRRKAYLKEVTALLVEDLEGVGAEWKDGEDNYRESFVALDSKTALSNMLSGMGNLSGAELSRERIEVSLVKVSKEDEHSCFSDNTKADIVANALSVQNIYLGRYGGVDGAGIDDLVEKLDPELNKKLTEQLETTVSLAKALPDTFDQAILDNKDEVQAVIDALRAQTATISDVADALDVTINLDEIEPVE